MFLEGMHLHFYNFKQLSYTCNIILGAMSWRCLPQHSVKYASSMLTRVIRCSQCGIFCYRKHQFFAYSKLRRKKEENLLVNTVGKYTIYMSKFYI